MDQNIYIRHEYKIEKGCLGDRGDENFFTRIEARYHVLDDDDQEVEVGRASFFHIDIDSFMRVQSELGEEVDIHGVLDLNGDTEPFTMLYDLDQEHFSENVCDVIGIWGDFSGSLFVINRLELLPNYRMKGVAAEAIAEAVRLFSGNADVVAITAFPLQLMDRSANLSDWEKKMQYDKFEQR